MPPAKPLSPRQAEVLRSHAFKPGQSGNPSGRKPGASALARAVSADGADCFDALIQIVKNDKHSPKDRTGAAELLLSYCYGRPPTVNAQVDLAASDAAQETADIAADALEALARSLANVGSVMPVSGERND